MPSIGEVKWNSHKSLHTRASISTQLLRNMKPGQTRRLVHDDVRCKLTKPPHCSIHQVLARLRRKEGWEIKSYHEKEHVIVIQRIK